MAEDIELADIVERLDYWRSLPPTLARAWCCDAKDAHTEIIRLRSQLAERDEALRGATLAENSNARRMREAIVEARRQLAKGRALWNGPCHQCDAVLEQALRADNTADAIARAALTPAHNEKG